MQLHLHGFSGMMMGYLFGALLPWRTVSWINIGFCVIPLILITLLRVPESPAWLLASGKEEEARTSLMWISKWKSVSSRVSLTSLTNNSFQKEKNTMTRIAIVVC